MAVCKLPRSLRLLSAVACFRELPPIPFKDGQQTEFSPTCSRLLSRAYFVIVNDMQFSELGKYDGAKPPASQRPSTGLQELVMDFKVNHPLQFSRRD
jgi:hypothetical protein